MLKNYNLEGSPPPTASGESSKWTYWEQHRKLRKECGTQDGTCHDKAFTAKGLEVVSDTGFLVFFLLPCKYD